MYHRFYARNVSVRINVLYITKYIVLELALWATFKAGKLNTSEGHVDSEVTWSESLTQSSQVLMRDPKIPLKKLFTVQMNMEGENDNLLFQFLFIVKVYMI